MNELKARFFLNASSVYSPAEQEAILRELGCARKVFNDIQLSTHPVLKGKLELLLKRTDKLNREQTFTRLYDQGVDFILKEDPAYPLALHDVQCPPHLLYVKGQLPEHLPAISIIGTRRPSMYGRRQAMTFATSLSSAGMLIVSGLARGIDSIALKMACEQQMPTVGILGTGIDVIYPPENGSLFEKVCEKGAIISEFPPGAKPLRPHFPWRNRLISGWSIGLLVVEAALKSGTMGTVRWALDQGKDVFALPGPVTQENSRGCHKIIKEGAYLVEAAEDIIEHFNFKGIDPQKQNPESEKNQTENTLGLTQTPKTIEELLDNNTLDYAEMTRELNLAISRGDVTRHPGARFSLK